MCAQSAFSQRNQETAAWKSARKMAKSHIFVGKKCLDGKVFNANHASSVIYYFQNWFWHKNNHSKVASLSKL
jgi:hypothetical protein